MQSVHMLLIPKSTYNFFAEQKPAVFWIFYFIVLSLHAWHFAEKDSLILVVYSETRRCPLPLVYSLSLHAFHFLKQEGTVLCYCLFLAFVEIKNETTKKARQVVYSTNCDPLVCKFNPIWEVHQWSSFKIYMHLKAVFL